MENLITVSIGNVFNTPFGKTQGIADFVSIILSNAVALAAFILFLLLVGGGIMIIASAGSGNKEGVGRGQKAVSSALIGFIIVFIAYWIIKIVELMFGFSILNP